MSSTNTLQRGSLALAQSTPYWALSHFERAVHYSPDHPGGTVGLCNILLDISSKKLAPLPTYQPLVPAGVAPTPPTSTVSVTDTVRTTTTASFDPMSHAYKP